MIGTGILFFATGHEWEWFPDPGKYLPDHISSTKIISKFF
jgi:hypothetical protein